MAGNVDEALEMIEKAVNSVEDAYSGVPYNPDEPGNDGRMYPPNEKFRYSIWERPGVRCYRQVAHATFVADNGAIEIRRRVRSDLSPDVLLEKSGRNGKKVSDYEKPTT